MVAAVPAGARFDRPAGELSERLLPRSEGRAGLLLALIIEWLRLLGDTA